MTDSNASAGAPIKTHQRRSLSHGGHLTFAEVEGNTARAKAPRKGIDFLTKSVEHVRGPRNPDQ
jgi:hypothetical protein